MTATTTSAKLYPVWRNTLLLMCKYGIGLGVLAWVLVGHWHLLTPGGEDVGLGTALERPVHAGLLLAAAGLTVTTLFITVLRWYLLVRAQELPFTFGEALRLGLVGYAVSTFLPGTVGGDLLKAACLARAQERRTAAAATVAVDRFIGSFGLYSLAAGAGVLFWATGLLPELVADPMMRELLLSAIALAGAYCAGCVAAWLLLCRLPENWSKTILMQLARVPKAGVLLAELWSAAWLYRSHGRAVAAAWVLSLANHAGVALTIYLAATTLSAPADVPPLAAHYLIVPIGSTIQASFPAPGGVGGGEYGFGLLYDRLGCTFAAGVLAALVARSLTWVVGFAGYLVYLRMRPRLAAMAAGQSRAPRPCIGRAPCDNEQGARRALETQAGEMA